MNNSLKGVNFLKNHPEARAQDLKQAFLDKDIKMIITAIGGDDTYKTIPYLMEDKEFIDSVKKNPKIFYAGDCVHGGSTAVEAVAGGKNAGLDISTFGENECNLIEKDLQDYTSEYRTQTNFKDEFFEDTSEGWFKNANEYNNAKYKMIKTLL